MDRKRLFLKTCDDLAQRVESDDEYDLLKISGLLRQLFLEDYPLVEHVNDRGIGRLRVRYRIGYLPPSPVEQVWTPGWQLDPDYAPKRRVARARVHSLNRDGFLGTPILRLPGHEYTVAEIIRYAAYVSGGVHPGSARTAKDELLDQTCRAFGKLGFSPETELLRSVSSVALKGLARLRTRVERDLPAGLPRFVTGARGSRGRTTRRRPSLRPNAQPFTMTREPVEPNKDGAVWLGLRVKSPSEHTAFGCAGQLHEYRILTERDPGRWPLPAPGHPFAWSTATGLGGRVTTDIRPRGNDVLDVAFTPGDERDLFALSGRNPVTFGYEGIHTRGVGEYVLVIDVAALSSNVLPTRVTVPIRFGGASDLDFAREIAVEPVPD